MRRKVDMLGRVVIPNKFCKENNIYRLERMEITVEYGKICVKKFQEENLKRRQFIGIVRVLESFNRVSIPREYLKILEIELGDIVNVIIRNNRVLFYKEI